MKVIIGMITKQERLKSALYLRLKTRKVSKLQKGDPSGFLQIQFVAKYQKKIKGGTFGDIWKNSKFFLKNEKWELWNSLIVPKTLKGKTLWAFWNFSLVQNIKKLVGGPFGDKKSKKVA